MIIPGGQPLAGSKIAIQIGLAAVTFAAEMMLPALLADIIAGKLIDKDTVGEAAGNAIASGSGGMMSDLALAGGNAPLRKSQARQMITVNNQVKLAYAAMDRSTKSPLDISSPNTFMGSIVSGFMPYIHSGDQTFFGKIKGIASISTSSISHFAFTPTYADTTETFDECTDVDYQDIDLATDPFCNVISGIPSASMNDDPNVINDRLLAQHLIDEETGEPIGPYAEFVAKCMNREEPFGSTGQDSTGDNGTGCFLDGTDQTKGDMYVHYVDMRVNDGMENGLNNNTSQSSNTDAATSQTANGGYALPVDQKWFDSNPEWFSKPHHDYPAADIPVPLGTPVYAITAGKVERAPNEFGYGEGVTIMGDDGVQYNYGHGSDGGLIVKAGDVVKAGQLIMHSASTGNSTGPHLHVDMKIGGIKHCPQSLLVALGKKMTTLPTPASLPISGCSN
jgi:murein DD-endopeptidase MepM/ murein hydrolase activator NlpD